MSLPPGPVTFIGDVHGWSDRLESILTAESDGPYVFMGDLVDRGPDVRAVVVRVRELCRAGRAACILGNHEYALVKAVGCPELGIAADPQAWDSWILSHGAEPTFDAYAVAEDHPEDLRRAMGQDLVFLAGLPWVLEGALPAGDARRWVAVHAGLHPTLPYAAQVASLRDAAGWWAQPFALHLPLYHKGLVEQVPRDLPAEVVLVSGHTPQPHVLARPQRIVCDTSGGRPGQPLSAVRWPQRRVLRSG